MERMKRCKSGTKTRHNLFYLWQVQLYTVYMIQTIGTYQHSSLNNRRITAHFTHKILAHSSSFYKKIMFIPMWAGFWRRLCVILLPGDANMGGRFWEIRKTWSLSLPNLKNCFEKCLILARRFYSVAIMLYSQTKVVKQKYILCISGLVAYRQYIHNCSSPVDPRLAHGSESTICSSALLAWLRSPGLPPLQLSAAEPR